MKSSLKTFLAGKNPFCDEYDFSASPEYTDSKLKGSTLLRFAVELNNDQWGIDWWWDDAKGHIAWYIDVLDDGTAITYCKN